MIQKMRRITSALTTRQLFLGLLVVVVAFIQTAFGKLSLSQEGGVCPTTRDAFVSRMLPSLLRFTIVNAEDFGAASNNPLVTQLGTSDSFMLPIPTGGGGTSPVRIDVQANDVGAAVFGEGAPVTFYGTLSGRSNSTATFFIRPRDEVTETPASIAGYVLLDRTMEGLVIIIGGMEIGAFNNWYFYESLRPLLESVLKAKRHNNPCTESDLDSIFPPDEEFQNSSIIIYEVRDTDFNMDLNPYNLVEVVEAPPPPPGVGTAHSLNYPGEPSRGYRTSQTQRQPDCFNEPCDVNLLFVADPKYVELMGDVQKAQEDIAAMMALFSTGATSNFYSLWGANLNIKTLTPEIWETEGNRTDGHKGQAPGTQFTDAPNAYQLLCDFTQNADHGHADDQNPTIVHLLTGWDLGKFPDGDQGRISDDGDGFCPSSCGGEGKAIVGLAEGIGGLREDSGDSCGLSPYTNAIPFSRDAHHSLSQHMPKASTGGETRNYDGTLFQRWVLMAHEIGHNLGAHHNESKNSVMFNNISQSVNYFLAYPNPLEINYCLQGIVTVCQRH